MREVATLSLQIALNVLVPLWIVRADMRRLDPHRLERCWNDATCLAAPVAFGPLCLPFHFVKSRRSPLGFLMGLGALVLAWCPSVLVGLAFSPSSH
ncbi:MAG TPA: hypothetical protein VGJ84_16175 [Polyangiaceae bacterium]|jgi:hypothetical protein